MCLMTVDTKELLADGLTLEQLGAVMKIKALSINLNKIPEQTEIVDTLGITAPFLGDLIAGKSRMGDNLHDELVSQTQKINRSRVQARERKRKERTRTAYQTRVNNETSGDPRDTEQHMNIIPEDVTRDMEKTFLKTFSSNLSRPKNQEKHVTRDMTTSHNAALNVTRDRNSRQRFLSLSLKRPNSRLKGDVTRDTNAQIKRKLWGVYNNKTLNKLNLNTELIHKENKYKTMNTYYNAHLPKKGKSTPKKPPLDINLEAPPHIDADTLKASCEEIFNQLWAFVPRKMGKKAALKHFRAQVNTPKQLKEFCAALESFKRQMTNEHRKAEFIPYGSSFVNNWQDWMPAGGLSRDEQKAAALAIMEQVDEDIRQGKTVTRQ